MCVDQQLFLKKNKGGEPPFNVPFGFAEAGTPPRTEGPPRPLPPSRGARPPTPPMLASLESGV